MQSYAVKEEAIKAWRMSQQLSNTSSHGSFTPPSLQSRRSEHFGSCPSSTPQMPSIRPRSELHSQHSPSSPHNPRAPTTSKGGVWSNQKSSSNMVPSMQTHSPWARSHVSNINTNNSGSTHSTTHGNSTTTLTTHSNHVVSKSPQRPPTTAQGMGGSVASNPPRVPPYHQTTKSTVEGVSVLGGDKDSTAAKRVTHRPPSPPPPWVPPKRKSASSPSTPVNGSPVPIKKNSYYSPTLPKKPSQLSGSSVADGTADQREHQVVAGANSSKEAAGYAGKQQQQADLEESGKINLVKARFERLEKKPSILKPVLAQKPRPGNHYNCYSDIASVYSVGRPNGII